MTTTINVHEAKTHFSKLLQRVLEGEEVIIAKAGKPVAILSPVPIAPYWWATACPARRRRS